MPIIISGCIYGEPQMYLLWDKYIVENKYIGELEFHQVLDTVDEVANLLAF